MSGANTLSLSSWNVDAPSCVAPETSSSLIPIAVAPAPSPESTNPVSSSVNGI